MLLRVQASGSPIKGLSSTIKSQGLGFIGLQFRVLKGPRVTIGGSRRVIYLVKGSTRVPTV